jgi:hypothetical protein
MDIGVSRGNSIALGVLVEHYGINFYDAWDLVKEKVPVCQINQPHIEFLKRKFRVTLPNYTLYNVR